jgi:hypothetical protein
MSAPQIEPGYPLAWPSGRPRTVKPKEALFRDGGCRLTLTSSRQRLHDQMGMLTKNGQPWRVGSMVLSTNIRFTASGSRDRNVSRGEPADAGVAFYFHLDRKPHVLACDRWNTVYDNIGAIAAHIDALRGQERWGVGDLQQAFAGHLALSSPDPWWAVLAVEPTATIECIKHAYRHAAKSAHPEMGGDRQVWDRLSAAYETAKKERSR